MNLTAKKEFNVFSQNWVYSFDPLTFHLNYYLGKNPLLVRNAGFVALISPEEMNVLVSTGLEYKYNACTYYQASAELVNTILSHQEIALN